jgi:YegS/Rv2252/BmrU family lipid kinase
VKEWEYMYYFIVNKTSGSGRSEKVWREVEQELKTRKIRYRAYFTNHRGHAGKLADLICAKDQEQIYLVVVGGDGTVNEVINGMHHFEKISFGYIPTGSGNDFARGLKIKARPKENLIHILEEKQIVAMDLGEVWWKGCKKKQLYAISSGIGLDAFVCKQALHSRLKKVLNKMGMGSLTYICLTLKALVSMPTTTARITFDDTVTRTYEKMVFIVGMNLPYEGGGVPMAPKASATDGKISVCCVWGIPRLKAFLMFPFLILGKHEKKKGFEVIECEKFDLHIEQMMVLHADGEYCGDVQDIKFKCLPDKLKIIL